MSIYRCYEWRVHGYNFWYKQYWPDSWLRELRELPHDADGAEDYDYFVFNDPFETELEDFFERVLATANGILPLSEPKDELEFLLSFVQHLRYHRERGDYPRYPSETLIDGGGDCEDTAILMAFISERLDYNAAFLSFPGHTDLGIVENYEGEFSGTYWLKDGERFYYVSCNGRGRSIGEYGGKWGDRAKVIML